MYRNYIQNKIWKVIYKNKLQFISKSILISNNSLRIKYKYQFIVKPSTIKYY